MMDTGEIQWYKKMVLQVYLEGNMEGVRKGKPWGFLEESEVWFKQWAGERSSQVLGLLFQLVSVEDELANQSPRARPC